MTKKTEDIGMFSFVARAGNFQIDDNMLSTDHECQINSGNFQIGKRTGSY